jgi:2-polyprenyl-3-methyl-5-hydroxy-6-metoxy-1,4-benzoquinol methylase
VTSIRWHRSSSIVALAMLTGTGVGRTFPALSSQLRPAPTIELREYGGPALVRRKRVIDVGCGDGRMALGCAPYAAEVVGVDPDPDAIRSARARARELGTTNVEFKTGVAQELPYSDEHFDVVMLSWTL